MEHAVIALLGTVQEQLKKPSGLGLCKTTQAPQKQLAANFKDFACYLPPTSATSLVNLNTSRPYFLTPPPQPPCRTKHASADHHHHAIYKQ